ncbi:MAG: polyprenyl synthetase family protein [Eubacteriales bacterium]|nr:polyprenyl synthetase family protein [Eubacteriales bacterium]
MTDIEFNNILSNDIRKVEHSLLSFLPDSHDGQNSVVEAMEYSLINGGKRLRPVFALEFAVACGGSRDDVLPLACAMEFVHTYSLIHDDLPCMDNDDLRRGKPSCHKAFGEDTALLAGDALLTHAFEIIASCDLSDDKKVSASLLLAQNAGVGGMIGGQVIDLIYEKEDPTVKQLLNVYRLKTGALISAACLMGCISAGADEDKLLAASKFAYSLGIAFQIQDDILDIIGDEKELGKPVGSDAENNKITYATLVGIEKAKNDVKRLTDSAIEQLDAFESPEFLKELAKTLVSRKK